jgi:L-seryl-tRNA(Ser) seleniumtransferase
VRKKGRGEAIITAIRRETSSNLAELPRVDRVVERAELRPLLQSIGQPALTKIVREAIDGARQELLGQPTKPAPSEARVAEDVQRRAVARFGARAQRVINATGVLLHTNLGRAPLSENAALAVAETMRGFAAIELDLETGKRGRRGAFLDSALAELAGAESAAVARHRRTRPLRRRFAR